MLVKKTEFIHYHMAYIAQCKSRWDTLYMHTYCPDKKLDAFTFSGITDTFIPAIT